MYDTGWNDTCYDGEDGPGRASGAGLDGGSGWTILNTFDPSGNGRDRREYGRHSFGKYEGFGYGTIYGSGEESNTGCGLGRW